MKGKSKVKLLTNGGLSYLFSNYTPLIATETRNKCLLDKVRCPCYCNKGGLFLTAIAEYRGSSNDFIWDRH